MPKQSPPRLRYRGIRSSGKLIKMVDHAQGRQVSKRPDRSAALLLLAQDDSDERRSAGGADQDPTRRRLSIGSARTAASPGSSPSSAFKRTSVRRIMRL